MDDTAARLPVLRERSARIFRAARREARAFARLASLLPLDWGASLPDGTGPGDDVVVLVHGTLATAGAFRPLRERLSAIPRTHTAGFTFPPSCGVVGVATHLASVLERLPRDARIHLVGHSLGGLAVRWFVQETEGDPRVVQTITVAAPFEGARGAWLFPGPAGRDMTSGSAVLRRLRVTASVPDLPHLSIFGDADTAVASSTSFPVGDRVVVADAGHNALLFHETVAEHVARALAARRADAVVSKST